MRHIKAPLFWGDGYFRRLAEELQNALGNSVGLSQHRLSGLNQDVVLLTGTTGVHRRSDRHSGGGYYVESYALSRRSCIWKYCVKP